MCRNAVRWAIWPNCLKELLLQLERALLVSWLWMYVCVGMKGYYLCYGLSRGSSASRTTLDCYAGCQNQGRRYFCPSGRSSTQPAQRAPPLNWLLALPLLCLSSPSTAGKMGQARMEKALFAHRDVQPI